jgi:NAD(P)-dependent dehydrogenase (short-subunit alcohol dehydrogenase family)
MMSRMPSVASFFQNKSVLITGASSGIGEELAWQLAQAGAKLTLAARRTDRLENLAERIAGQGTERTPGTQRTSRPIVVECDVTRDGDLERAVAESVRAWGKLDIAFANAGFGVVAPLKKLALEDYRRQFETNVFGVLRTIYAALPELEKSRGNLAIIGSVSSWVATPGASPYSMSKFALRALANAITPELRPTGIKVTLISPGFVASDIRRIDNQGNFHAGAKDPIPPRMVVPTPKAAREILRAVARGKREQIVTGHGKVFVAIERFAPWILRAATSRTHAIRAKDDTRKWE